MTIEAGEVILRSEPFCAILEGQAVQSHCSFCFFRIESDELLKCSACRVTRYCDEECKLQDVESHQDECSILAENPDICDSVRMVVKLILKLDRNKECGVDNAEVYSGGTRSFEDLMSHKEHLSQEGENFTLIQKFHRVMSGLLGPKAPNFETFLEIYGRLIINGFEICDGNQSIKGWGLYLAPSILDHSCAPNATVSFLGRTIFVRTLVDMESPLKWNEVRISYIDLMETSEMRQKKLLEQYQFHCDCPRCVSSTRQLMFKTEGSKPCLPKSEALLYCMRCQHCSGRPVYIGPPEPDLSMASISNNNNNNHCPNICQNCEQPPSMEHLKKYYQIYEKVDHALERDERLSTKELASFFSEMTGLFYPQHRLMVRIAENLFEANFRFGETLPAFEYGSVCDKAYQEYGAHGPRYLGSFYSRWALVLERMGKAKQAIEVNQKALNILQGSHGRTHSMWIRTKARVDQLLQNK
ncbi:uncharacterized protein LOC131893268 [Tigriopus californicus]|uniref:uncharacterized protein LOC131893268 n=1 Tax=Tigriopus californicus TaxID=6832 RepID=UPI0027DA82FD|nr:uncharacterized protein LOC131893268 [Tigriopus californicus]